jgi:hypothetical protein
MTSQRGRRPDFIVIGATKAGTTSLDFYLGIHPEVSMAKPKELRFFVDSSAFRGRWDQGVEWYENQFCTRKKLCGEASPQYAHLPHVPERMAAVVPRAKLIYMVREPMARLQSDYLMAVRHGRCSGSFASYIDEHPYALEASLYGKQISRFLNYFSPSSILVLESQSLQSRRHQALRQVFDFIGADPEYSSVLFQHERNVAQAEIYPNRLGRRIDRSRVMQWSKRTLPSGVHYHLRNLILAPLAGTRPSTALPEAKRESIDTLFRQQVEQLRSLTGQPLPSLDPPLTPSAASSPS